MSATSLLSVTFTRAGRPTVDWVVEEAFAAIPRLHPVLPAIPVAMPLAPAWPTQHLVR
jgi:hypothetical protein